MTIPEQRIIVLGAGFSAPAGLPLGVNLLEAVREQVKQQFRRADWDGTLEREIREWQSLYPGQELDLERVLAYSHRKHYLRLIGSEEYFTHGSRTIVAARRAVQEILIGATPKKVPELYLEFAARLKPTDTIVTFNYDTLLEMALDDTQKPYTLTPEWWLDEGFGGGARPKHVDVLKLHGSVDWYDREYHETGRRWLAEQGHDLPDGDPLFGESPSVPKEPLAKGVVTDFGREILNRVVRVPNHSSHYPISAKWWAIVPVILPPAYDKLLGYSPILDLWENLHKTVGTASAVVIIGYSMPRHDSHAYEALGQALVNYQRGESVTQWGHRRVPIQIIDLADREQDVHDRFPFLDLGKTRIWKGGFSTNSLEWIDWGSAE